MLILSRKPNESLVIQENIVVTILDVEGDKVKLGIQAPRDITILRHELCQEDELTGKTPATGKAPANNGNGKEKKAR